MTTFETIIVIIAYMFCYGYAAESLLSSFKDKEDKIWIVLFCSVIAWVYVVIVPVSIGMDLYHKLKR